jgi:predicted transposase YdaD
LASWKISIEITGQAGAEKELMMVLTQAFLEWEQQTEQVAEVRLILRQLTRRIGSLAAEMRSQVQALSLAQLESLGEALLDFAEAGDLERWLREN